MGGKRKRFLFHASNRERWVREHPIERQNKLTTLVLPRRLYIAYCDFIISAYIMVGRRQSTPLILNQTAKLRENGQKYISLAKGVYVKTVGVLTTMKIGFEKIVRKSLKLLN